MARSAEHQSILTALSGGKLSPELAGEANALISGFKTAQSEGNLTGEGSLFELNKQVGPLSTRIGAELGRKKSEFEARRKETTRFRTGRSSTIFAGGQPTIAPQQGTASTLLGL